LLLNLPQVSIVSDSASSASTGGHCVSSPAKHMMYFANVTFMRHSFDKLSTFSTAMLLQHSHGVTFPATINTFAAYVAAAMAPTTRQQFGPGPS
jgi:hypothetical protein